MYCFPCFDTDSASPRVTRRSVTISTRLSDFARGDCWRVLSWMALPIVAGPHVLAFIAQSTNQHTIEFVIHAIRPTSLERLKFSSPQLHHPKKLGLLHR